MYHFLCFRILFLVTATSSEHASTFWRKIKPTSSLIQQALSLSSLPLSNPRNCMALSELFRLLYIYWNHLSKLGDEDSQEKDQAKEEYKRFPSFLIAKHSPTTRFPLFPFLFPLPFLPFFSISGSFLFWLVWSIKEKQSPKSQFIKCKLKQLISWSLRQTQLMRIFSNPKISTFLTTSCTFWKARLMSLPLKSK